MQWNKISPELLDGLRCPVCRAKLDVAELELVCTNTGCETHFPVVDNVPILINENSSIFSIADYRSKSDTTRPRVSKLERALERFIPQISGNVNVEANYSSLTNLLCSQSSNPKVLVVGGATLGKGMSKLASHPSVELIETDVSIGPRTMLVCDAHDIPFDGELFDGVIAQAVLEHVADPYQCVEEIHRVLKPHGVVYAQTPFIQQVHMGRYDFTRFTHLGHRRLFRRFDEIESGITGGPGTALAWSYRYFLLSFVSSRTLRKLVGGVARFTSFFLKYFDYYLVGRPGSLDAASGYYFVGRKSAHILADRDLIGLYKGLNGL